MRASIRVTRAIDPGLRVVGSVGELHRIVMNLLLNARDAMPSGGRLDVTLQGARDGGPASGPSVRLSVRDSGAGMDAATRAQVFDPLFTTKAKGTGLGLATVARVVAAHGGRVSCDSAPGAGTTFVIVLPRAVRDVREPITETLHTLPDPDEE